MNTQRRKRVEEEGKEMWLQETDKKEDEEDKKKRGRSKEKGRREEEQRGRVLALLARRMLGNFS